MSSQGRTTDFELFIENKAKYFAEINLRSPTESYQPITFANHRQVSSTDTLTKTLQ